MITANGYSKENVPPEGIVITFGQEMMKEQGGVKHFLENFLETMANHQDGEGDYWMHKCKNLPKVEVDHIYISCCGRLYGRVFCGGYVKPDKDNPQIGYTADGREQEIKWNYIRLFGPLERCPFKRKLSGFQGFRYAEKLW